MIDPYAAVPRYIQLANILEDEIRSRRLPAGRALPSEATLQQRYGLARQTCRKAVAVLRDRGLAITVRGLGSFVVEKVPPRS
ncbi:GntR family transcriptional regulator [Dactylosporangium sp. NPDC051541]|uniref:GntR family transcriptional regulator n=1 Tax=Dactylosporangium sp. NPDC051541 TaxID=3363977 RepID=UPI00379FEBB2